MISINIAIAFLILPQVFAGLIQKDQTSNGYLSDDELAAYQSRLATYRIRQAAIVYHIGEDGGQQIDFDLLSDLERDDRILEAAISFHRHDKGLHLHRDPRLVIQDDDFNDQETTPLTNYSTSNSQEEKLSDIVKHQQTQVVVGNHNVLLIPAPGFHQGRHFMDDSNDDISLICHAAGFTNLDGNVAIGERSVSLLRSDDKLQEDDPDVLTTVDQHPQQMMVVVNQTVILPSYSDPAVGFDHEDYLIVDVDSNDDKLSLRPLADFTNHVSSIFENVNDDDAHADPFDEPAVAFTTSDIFANHYFQVQRLRSLLEMVGSDDGVIIAHPEPQRSLATTEAGTVSMEVRNCCFIADVDPDLSMLAQPCLVLRIKGVIYGCPLANAVLNNVDLLATLSGLPLQQMNFDEISMLVHQGTVGDAAIHLCSVKLASEDDDDDDNIQIDHCCRCASGEESVHIVKQHVAPAPLPTDTPPPLDPDHHHRLRKEAVNSLNAATSTKLQSWICL